MYNGIKISCPANQWKSDWLVSTSSGYVPDSKLVIKCIGNPYEVPVLNYIISNDNDDIVLMIKKLLIITCCDIIFSYPSQTLFPIKEKTMHADLKDSGRQMVSWNIK